jgi:integrase
MLLGTGLRISELLALCVGDVSLEERSGEVTVRYGKGGVYRTVPLTSVVRKAVRDSLETQPELKPDDLLWVGERGVLTDRGSVLYLLKKYAFQARLDERLISPHVLRYTFATRYLSANPDDLRGLAALSWGIAILIPGHDLYHPNFSRINFSYGESRVGQLHQDTSTFIRKSNQSRGYGLGVRPRPCPYQTSVAIEPSH